MKDTVNEAAAQKAAGGSRLKDGGGHGALIALGVTGGLLAALAAGYVALCAYASQGSTIWKNTYILGQDVGGLTAEQAAETVRAALPDLEIGLYLYDSALDFPPEHGETPDASIPLADLGADINVDALVAGASAASKEGSFLTSGVRFLAASGTSTYYGGGPQDITVNSSQAAEVAEDVAAEISWEKQDTTYTTGEDTLSVTMALDGRTVDAQALQTGLERGYWDGDLTMNVPYTVEAGAQMTAQEIHDAIAGEMKNAGYDAETDTITPEQLGADFDVADAQSRMDAAAPGETVTIPAAIEYPTVTAEELKAVLFRDVLGEATTHVSGTGFRVTNVKLSSEAFNNTIMNTGDVFSYNETVGKRTEAKGYGPASAYIQGETVDVIGGGVCQPSSTLYLACLLANLEITERYAHRFVPSYIPKGMDATVSWGGPDYKFTNNTDYPIKISAIFKNNNLTVRILGTKTDDITVKMTYEQLSSTPFETVYEEDPTLAPGEETVKTTPYTGYRVRTYRNLYDGTGKLISSSYEATSDYKSRNKVILRGPSAAADAPVTDFPIVLPSDPQDTSQENSPAPPQTDWPEFLPPDPAPLNPGETNSSGDPSYVVLPETLG